MKLKEALDILSNGNPAISEFSPSKGGRYWFDDDAPVTEDEMVALFGLALDKTKEPIQVEVGWDDESEELGVVTIELNENQEFTIPQISIELARSMYADRANGYCYFTRLQVKDGKFAVVLGGELCLDELLAIYTIAKHAASKR